jgi:hypothetical protein
MSQVEWSAKVGQLAEVRLDVGDPLLEIEADRRSLPEPPAVG